MARHRRMEMKEPNITSMGVVEYRNGIENKYVLSYQYYITDAGRSESKRPKQSNDCTVRAIAISTNSKYDEIYDLLKDAGRKCSRGFHITKWLPKQIINNFKFTWIAFPAVKNEKRINPSSFSKKYQEGIYIIRTAKHVSVFKDGIHYDAFEIRPDRCIYGCWKLEKI